MSVLVVEDDAVSRDAISKTLQQEGYDVRMAADGREALELLADGDCRLVITDWMMPGLTGIQLCQALRAGIFGGSIYVIVVTSLNDPRDRRLALSSGANAFIPKPWSRRQLLDQLKAGERALETRCEPSQPHGCGRQAAAKSA